MLEALPDTLQSWTPDELEGSLSANNFNQPERSEQLCGYRKEVHGIKQKTSELCPARTRPRLNKNSRHPGSSRDTGETEKLARPLPCFLLRCGGFEVHRRNGVLRFHLRRWLCPLGTPFHWHRNLRSLYLPPLTCVHWGW